MELDDFLAEWQNGNKQLLVHTSGSTGAPKPLWVEKERMLQSARITCDFLGLQPGDTALLCMSLDYIAGKMMVVRSIERQLQLVMVRPCGHPLADPSLLPATGIDFAAMVPMQVYNTLQVPTEREQLARIKHLIIGGGAIDEALEKELQKLPGAVWSTYGMTETLSHIALRRLNGPEASEWYQPFDSVKISLSAENCLVIDAPLVCAAPLATNDIAEIKATEQGPLFRIKGRKDNVICSGGIKIQIEEVEALLQPHLSAPFLLAKKKDSKFGEIAVLVSTANNLAEIKQVCQTQLPKYWIPREYIHMDKLPLTGTGKPKRNLFL